MCLLSDCFIYFGYTSITSYQQNHSLPLKPCNVPQHKETTFRAKFGPISPQTCNKCFSNLEELKEDGRQPWIRNSVLSIKTTFLKNTLDIRVSKVSLHEGEKKRNYTCCSFSPNFSHTLRSPTSILPSKSQKNTTQCQTKNSY